MKIITLFKEKRHYLVPFLFFVILLGTVQTIYGRDEIHLYINQYHSPFADFFFKYITYLGGGIGFALLLVFLFLQHRTKAYIFAAGYAAISILVQLLKRTVFSDITRPLGYFNWKEIPLYQVPGTSFKTQYSFPSGHSADIFYVTCCFVLLYDMVPTKQRVFFYIAALVGFSRVYLSQHFLIDIYVGAIIGVLFGLFTVAVGKRILDPKEL